MLPVAKLLFVSVPVAISPEVIAPVANWMFVIVEISVPESSCSTTYPFTGSRFRTPFVVGSFSWIPPVLTITFQGLLGNAHEEI